MLTPHRIMPCLWFDHQAEEAAQFYCGIFPDARIVQVSRYPGAGQDVHGRAAGSVMTVNFELEGQPLLALNGGPMFRFNEAVSLQILCADQDEVDHYWTHLGAGGDPQAQQCGWLKDRYGLSWQVVPRVLPALLSDPDASRAGRAMQAMLQMKKLDIGALQRAAA